MLDRIRRTLRELRNHTSGNATLLVALGMPALIGGAGLAVDTAQWYMWKRELQYAVDQAALAGAWARTKSDTASTYATRARQEFNSNLATTADISSDPQVSLTDYNGGDNNSVTVRAEAEQSLPFSSFLTGRATTVYAYAQAAFEEGESFSSCLIAVDEDDSGAVTIGGSVTLTARCGIAALSTSDSSIIINGSPTVDPGWVLSKGGIDDWFDTYTDADVHEYMTSLSDPFAGLSPPDNPTAREYACTPAGTTTTADVTEQRVISYSYYKGSSQSTAVATTYASPKTGSTTTDPTVNRTVPNGTVNGTVPGTPVDNWQKISGSGRNTIWEVRRIVTNLTYANVVATTTPEQANLQPGTYSDIRVRCTTVFNSGVYVIDGGGLEIHGQYEVTGAGVMFVLKNGAYMIINGGSNISLTAMTTAQLEAAGVSSTQAVQLAGMLMFEDRASSGTNRNTINGNASTILNGTVYLPVSNIALSGTAGVTSQCLMIAAATITMQGDLNMSTFCPSGMEEDTEVASGAATVKLVA